MTNKKKFDISIPMLDFFMNLALGVVVLLIITIFLINPISKKNDVSAKADIMIIMDWPDSSTYDVDLHIKTPGGDNVYFRNKEIGYVVLDRDDQGQVNDTFQTPDGQSIKVLANREILTLRSPVDGEYIIAAHLYATQDENPPEHTIVKVEIIELNPFKIVLNKSITLTRKSEEKHIANLILNDRRVTDIDFEAKAIVGNTSGIWRQ